MSHPGGRVIARSEGKGKRGRNHLCEAAVEKEWPAMSREIDMDDPLYAISDSAQVSLIADLSHEAVMPGSSPVSAMMLPQISKHAALAWLG